jgi:hypothetical protein
MTDYIIDVDYHVGLVGVPISNAVHEWAEIFYQLELTLNDQFSDDDDDNSEEEQTRLPEIYPV